MASQAEGDESIKNELETALRFFEKSSNESTYFNPAKFCLPFYRSFYSITFKKEDVEAEVKQYLTEAKSAVEGSKSKEKLLEAVENLGNALKEAQKMPDFSEVKADINAYRRYCDRACELLDTTEEKAPGASRLIRRGLPIIDKKIKGILTKIEENARNFCRESRQTQFKKVSAIAYDKVKGLGELTSPIEAETRLNRLSPLLRSMCRILPEESRGLICHQLDEIEKADLSDKANIMGSALSSIAVAIMNLEKELEEQKKQADYLKNLIIQQLDSINYGVFHLKLRSGEIVPVLHDIQKELNKLKTIKTDIDNFGFNLKEIGNVQHQGIQQLNDEITRLSEEIKIEILKMPQNSDTSVLLERLQKLHESQPSGAETWFNRAAALSSIVSLLLTLPAIKP